MYWRWGGWGTQYRPTGDGRGFDAREEEEDLTLLHVVGGIAADWMIASGCVKKVMFIIVNLDEFGVADQLPGARWRRGNLRSGI